ncbi:MAG TPA: KTSC domain-containing protein [Puia sp.]|nr:KTSC domain-containing protein [Puia sp.]
MPSSVIHHIIYNEGNQRLRVFFVSGLTYDYINVPKELYDRLRQAFSKGKFLNEHIKGKYPFEKVKEN